MYDGKVKLGSVHSGLKKSFDNVKRELEDHLDSINENTNEIQSNYEYNCEIDSKVSKLSERIDEIQYLLEKFMSAKEMGVIASEYRIQSDLSLVEQEVFVVLYTLAEDESISFLDLAKRVKLTSKALMGSVESMRQKGIPTKRVIVDGYQHLFLDNEFKSYQARNNVVKISEKLVKYL